MKVCSKCKIPKTVDEFANSKGTRDGKQNYCKLCQNEYRRQNEKSAAYTRRYYLKNRQARIDAQVERKRGRKRQLVLEHGGRCKRCGYDRSVVALSFHHRDPTTKVFEIANCSYGIERLRVEAAKCDLLCLNCHAEVAEFPAISEASGEYIA